MDTGDGPARGVISVPILGAPPEAAAAHRSWTGLLHGVALAAAFAGLFAWSWGRWPDVLIDFGRELYVPWQMAKGRQLFTDLAWFYGPLSPYWNAAMFRLFGVGLSTLVWVNAALFAVALALLHFVLRSFSSRGAATAACLAVMALCGFGQLVGIANYNFICPYSHGSTHGTVLALAALALLQAWRGRRSMLWVYAAGLCAGLTFLTKPEPFVAVTGAMLVGLALHGWSARVSVWRPLGAFTLGLLAPVAAAWGLLSVALGMAAGWRATLGSWAFSGGAADMPFYRLGLGLDAPGANTLAMLEWALGILAALAVILGVAWWVRNDAHRAPAAVGAGLAALFTIEGLSAHVHWLQAARAWPLAALGALVYALWMTRRHRGTARWPAAATFATFALLMLAKMLLNARLYQYGFVLALPATALIAVALYAWIPDRLDRAGRAGVVFRTGGFALLAGLVAVYLVRMADFRAVKTTPIGSGADAFVGDARSAIVGRALDWLDAHTPAGAPRPTAVVVPEGVMINYLGRLDNPTPYVTFLPSDMSLFGEAEIVAAFQAHPPDFVLLTHRDTSEYGPRWFGADYGRTLMGWITSNYVPAALFGDPPLVTGSRFGIRVLRRR